DVISPSPPKALIPTCIKTFLRNLKKPNSGILIKLLKKLPGTIIRIAIANDQFPITERLTQNRLHPLPKKREGI
ncbi:hypothetical protein N9059_00480, partial [bacterium]|nr:hypothetical protein [bacterium]